MDLPSVSIVTPSYNQAQFLEATIRSVLEQDYPYIEYIICDGGSTDGSVDIIKKYADRLAFWVSERDEGQSNAINKGLLRANGEILGWLNSDDCYLPGCVSAVVETFDQHPEAGMVYGDVEIIDEDGRRIGKHPSRPYKFVEQLTHRMIIPQPAAFWRREVLNKVGFLRTDLHYAMDFDYWIRIGRQFHILKIDRTLAQYRITQVSKSTSQGYGWGPELLIILKDFFNSEDLPPEIIKIKRIAFAGAYQKGADTYLTVYETRKAFKWLLHAVYLYPEYLFNLRWWFSLFRALSGKHLFRLGRWSKHQIRKRLWLRAPTHHIINHDS